MNDYRAADVSLVASSQPMAEVRELALRVAAGDAKVLITGESGAGKDVVARFIHAHSPRADRPFVPVNCAGVPETLLESELFGHVKGSFTGAYRDKTGRLQLADGGTIFLDEIGEMSPRMQGILLRFLQNGEVHPLGADRTVTTVDVRVISATNRDLRALVREGRFREDLMYRVNVLHIHVPPLRERIEDIPTLVREMMARRGCTREFTSAALDLMMRYPWPGNVRELQNVIEQVIWLAGSDQVRPVDLPATLRSARLGHSPFRRERRRQPADDLFATLASGEGTFWETVYEPFQQRDLTRHDLRELVRRGLAHTGGNYRQLLPLFGIGPDEYKRFLNFLAAHNCVVDFRSFRRNRAAEHLGGPTAAPDDFEPITSS